jgi:sterol desaturase/sphingolipid hydroxylase (fatty acid hydroxylase superfamily)
MAKPKSSIDEHGQNRDRRGEWRSGRPVWLEPLFDRPKDINGLFRWMFGFPGMLYPWFAIFMLLIGSCYIYFTPDLARMKTFEWSWIIEIFVRNFMLIFLWNSIFHFWFIKFRMQGRKKKYNGNWMSTNNSTFLFSDQVYDNIFWSSCGVLFWSTYECGLWMMYANDTIPFVSFDTNPVYFCLWMLVIPFWRNFHFYWIHRLIHWKPLYDRVHYIHHKNVNVGPWSGLSMHPGEHFLYFSCMLIHLVVPSHPLHMMFNGFQTALGPAISHSGFDEIVFGDEAALRTDRYMHYLHHRFHNVNFGESNMPLDKLFGSFHDGTPEADEHFRKLHSAKIIEAGKEI